MKLRRWTPFTFVAPHRYVDRDDAWSTFDLETWSANTYEWTADPWNGFRDFAQEPLDTGETGRGDCEDYALVAVAWASASGRTGIGLAFCWKWPYPWPTHVVAYDDERVYSSGSISEETVEEWVAESEYVYSVRRPIE